MNIVFLLHYSDADAINEKFNNCINICINEIIKTIKTKLFYI